MQYQKESSIICFGNTKQAALYFDRIFPFSFVFRELFSLSPYQKYITKLIHEVHSEEDLMNLNPEFEKIMREELLKEFSNNKTALNKISLFNKLLGEEKSKYSTKLFLESAKVLLKYSLIVLQSMKWYLERKRLNEFPEITIKQFNHINELANLYLDANLLQQFMEALFNLLCIFYIEDVQLHSLSKEVRKIIDAISTKFAGHYGQVLIPSFVITNERATQNDVSLTLSNINLIDTSKVTWEQIIEYRKDVTAKKKIRNLRLFLNTNYQGKSLAFIEDDLGKRLDEYCTTCKDWGFDTITSTISAVMDSEKLIPLIAGSTGATLFGGPLAGLAIGGGILIANIALNVVKGKHAFNKFKRDHELAYIIEAKERFGNSSKP